jgi:carboxypeptidase C (cathepsin A)
MSAPDDLDQPATRDDYRPPAGASSHHQLTLADGRRLDYEARADWIILRKREKPVAEMFHVAYTLAGESAHERPLTFVFNGGPGAASAYLHMGAVGPKRVSFSDEGRPYGPPTRIEDNPDSWLEFTDLVFIDPVGTGFSRGIDRDSARPQGDASAAKSPGGTGRPQDAGRETPENEFFGLNRDLESLGEMIRSFLSRHHRWDSPTFIAGESYGGFRVAKLARLLQERYGVGLNGAVLISPALEFSTLDASDYDLLPWLDIFPSLALAAAAHGRYRAANLRGVERRTIAAVREQAEAFASDTLARLLVCGDRLSDADRSTLHASLAKYTGLDEDYIARNGARIHKHGFARELLRDERKVVGLYDASVSVTDAFPDRDGYEGPDASLAAIDRVFTAGINAQVRRTLGLQTDRDYLLLNFDVNRAWKLDYERHVLQSQIGATDDLRYSLQLNPFMRVRISHGIYDLVTPYFSSERIAANMKLDAATRERMTLRHYAGGHMFYTWKDGREAFTSDMRAFYGHALAAPRA